MTVTMVEVLDTPMANRVGDRWSPGIALRSGVSGPMQAIGGLFAMSADAVRFVFRKPFQWREFLEQLNRPGMSGDSTSWEGWSHVRWFIEEVPAGAS